MRRVLKTKALRGVLISLAVTGAFSALTGCTTVGGPTYPAPKDYPVHGVDVSRYQGAVDWNALKGAGTRFAYIKATEGGDYADENFALHWMQAHDAGVKRGAYHFYFWCRPVQDQIAWFFKNVPVEKDALPPVLDVEWTGDSPTCSKKVPRAVALANMRTFLTAAEQHYGKRPVIYTTIDFYRDVIIGDLHEYPLWVRTVRAHPVVRYGERPWVMWQYTAEGRLPGIKGPVDRNAFAGSEEDWEQFTTATASGAASPAVATAPSVPVPAPRPSSVALN